MPHHLSLIDHLSRAESIRERQGLSSLHHQPLVGPSAPRGATPLGRLRPLHLSRIASIYERQALSSQHPAPPTTDRLTGRALCALRGYSRTCRNGSTNRKPDTQATSADALFAKVNAQHVRLDRPPGRRRDGRKSCFNATVSRSAESLPHNLTFIIIVKSTRTGAGSPCAASDLEDQLRITTAPIEAPRCSL